MVHARMSLNEYTNKVLNVIKAKFDLHDKSEAMDKFAEMYGDEIVEKEADEKFVKDVIRSCEQHIKKYGHRKMSLNELDKICGIK
ncbi:MAG: DUF2683 family protein [Candidatus Woesearchaeota archaeon]